MTPSPGPIQPHHAGSPSRVIQGFFPGGSPRSSRRLPRPGAGAAVRAGPGPGPACFSSGSDLARPSRDRRSSAVAPPRSASPADPAGQGPAGAVQPATPVRPQAPQPTLPQRSTPSAVQPHAGNAFALPGNFTLKPRGSGQPLPEPIQKKMESFFNTSFADVRVHVGNEAPSIGALAFTHGSDLYFAPGQYNPQSSQGQQLLGHELTHVVQQRAGRVRNPFGSNFAVVQDRSLELEADRMGRQAATPLAPAPIQRRQSLQAHGIQAPSQCRFAARMQPHRGVIQRVICIPSDDLDKFELWHQVFNMLKKHPDEDVQILEQAKGRIKSGDRLAIVAHGSEKRIAKWYSPNILANELGKLKLPDDLKKIELLTCMSGWGDEKSYAAELARQLFHSHRVKGYRGYSFTTPEGKNRAEIPNEARSVLEKLDIMMRIFKENGDQFKGFGINEPGLDAILKATGLTRQDLSGNGARTRGRKTA